MSKTWKQHRVEVKAHARMSLHGNFFKAVFAGVVFTFFASLALSFLPLQVPDITAVYANPEELFAAILPSEFTPQIIELFIITFVLYLLLTAPLNIGIHRFYLLANRGEKPKFRIIFSSFLSLREIFSSCALTIVVFIWQLLWALLLLAAPLALFVFSPILGPLAEIASYILYFAAMVLLLIAYAPFPLAPFIFAEDPARGAFKSVLLAMKLTRGRRRELCVFHLSFALWRFLFSFNIPGAFFIAPYINMSTARFYDTLN